MKGPQFLTERHIEPAFFKNKSYKIYSVPLLRYFRKEVLCFIYNLISMPELITIEEAARLTGFPAEEIQHWVRCKKITSYSTKTGGRLVETTNLHDFISSIEYLGMQKLYLQLTIQDKAEEVNELIARYDDYLFCLRSLATISPLLKRIIAELATFIHNKQDRYIFTEITRGTKIGDVAKHCDASYDRMCHRYKNILTKLESETHFLLEYQKKITSLELEIERLRLENRNMDCELKKLYRKGIQHGLQLTIPQTLIHIPLQAAKRICKPVTYLTLSPYIRKILGTLKIETMEDLLRYAESKGLDSLLSMPGFGELGLRQLKFQLEKHKIIDPNGYSELFQYIVSDPDN